MRDAEMLYLQRRAEAESDLAEHSQLEAVRTVHRQLAELYRARLADAQSHVARS